jgi:hypothetical protein
MTSNELILNQMAWAKMTVDFDLAEIGNGTACLKNLKQLFEFQHSPLLRHIWWSKF